MKLEEYIDQVNKKLETYSGEDINLCADLYKFIKTAPEDYRIDIFARICESYGTVTSNHTAPSNEKIFYAGEVEDLEDTWGDLIDEILLASIKKAIKLKQSNKQFYSEIWRMIVCNSAFTEEKENIFAMYYVLIDRRIPYYCIDSGLKMDKKQYKSVFLENIDSLKKVRFILSLDFDQKTQQSSNVLDVILEQKSYESKVLILAYALNIIRKDQEKYFRSIMDTNND